MKFVFSAALAALMLVSVCPAFAQTDVGLNAGANFSKVFLRLDGQTIADLSYPAAGIDYMFALDGDENTPGTWGLNFSTSFLGDEDIQISTVSSEVWKDLGKVTAFVGVQTDFVIPGDRADTTVKLKTNMLGFCSSLRFNVDELPAEFGGSYSFAFDGEDGLQKGELFLGLRL